jgi:3-phosphoshikimate 1-carboxyvinyltransferase
MAGAISALGASVDRNAGVAHGPDVWTVRPGWAGQTASIDVGNAGTVLRFVPPVAALARADVRFSGDPRAAQRPVGQVLAGLRQLGVEIDDGGRDAVPFTVRGRGRVRGGTVTLDASSSSQSVSALMLAAPRYEGGVRIQHAGGRIPSAPHIAMTTAMLGAAGVTVETGSSGGPAGQGTPDSWRVAPGPVSPGAIQVEPDLSNAGPFLAAALVTGGSVTIRDWPAASLQAADAILDVLTRLGGSVTQGDAGLTVTGSGVINGIDADLRDIPELCLPLTSVAALASGPSTFSGVGHTRLQETDRLAAITKEINALGGDVTELPDSLTIRPRPLRAEPGHVFESYDDHRMVMAAAVLGLAVPGIEVTNVATVGKTFPDFTARWGELTGVTDTEPRP